MFIAFNIESSPKRYLLVQIKIQYSRARHCDYESPKNGEPAIRPMNNTALK